MITNLKSPVYVLDVAWGETISLAFSHSTGNIRLFGRWSWEHYKLLNRPPRYPNLVSDETLPSLWRWLRAETSMERSECTLADIGRVISPPDQIVGTCPGALLKNRVWTPSLGKLGPNYIAYWHTNQIAWSGNCIIAEDCISTDLSLSSESIQNLFFDRLQGSCKNWSGNKILVELFFTICSLELTKYQSILPVSSLISVNSRAW